MTTYKILEAAPGGEMIVKFTDGERSQMMQVRYEGTQDLDLFLALVNPFKAPPEPPPTDISQFEGRSGTVKPLPKPAPPMTPSKPVHQPGLVVPEKEETS